MAYIIHDSVSRSRRWKVMVKGQHHL